MILKIHLRVYEELNEYLPPDQRKRRFVYTAAGVKTIRQLLARLGIPESQIELVLVNGNSVRFSYHLKEEDVVSLYPVFESFDMTAMPRPRKKTLRITRFIVGPGLLRLAGYLRQLGLDTLICRAGSLAKYLEAAEEDQRTLLTRDPALLKSAEISRKYLVQETAPKRQLQEVLARFDIHKLAKPKS
jgi:sulfur carrier protein ThiS